MIVEGGDADYWEDILNMGSTDPDQVNFHPGSSKLFVFSFSAQDISEDTLYLYILSMYL